MSNMKLAAVFAGLESDGQDMLDIGGPEVVEEVISQATDAETAAAEEVVEVADSVAEDVEQQDDLEEVKEALENFATFLDAAGKQGGLGKTAAYAVGMGIESHLDRIGLSLSDVMPSIESFGNEADKSESTKSFGGKIKEVIAKIWEAVVKFTNSIIDKIAEMYNRLKNWSPLMQRKAAALQKAAKELANDPGGKEVKLSGALSKKLFMGAEGKVDLAVSAKAAVNGVMAMVSTGGALPKMDGSVQISDEDAMGVVKEAFSASSQSVAIKVPEGYTVISTSEELPGGKVVALIVKQKDGKPDYKSAAVSVRDAHEGAAEKLKEGTTITSPNKQALINIAQSVGELAKATDKMVASRQNTLKVLKASADKAKAAASKDIKGEDAAAKAAATEMAQMARVATKVTAQTIDSTVKISFGTAGKGLLEAVAQCIKAAGGDAGKEEAGKKEEAKA